MKWSPALYYRGIIIEHIQYITTKSSNSIAGNAALWQVVWCADGATCSLVRNWARMQESETHSVVVPKLRCKFQYTSPQHGETPLDVNTVLELEQRDVFFLLSFELNFALVLNEFVS